MSGPGFSDDARIGDVDANLPDVRERRRLLARTLLRIFVATVVLLLLYALVPIPGTSGAAALIGLLVGLAVFLALIGWQIWAIARARNPVMRALEAVAVALPLLTVMFAFTYLSISRADPAAFSEHLDRVDAIYFTMSTLATVGFGDLTASTTAARILVTVQMAFDLALIAGLARFVVLATRTGLQRREAAAAPARPEG